MIESSSSSPAAKSRPRFGRERRGSYRRGERVTRSHSLKSPSERVKSIERKSAPRPPGGQAVSPRPAAGAPGFAPSGNGRVLPPAPVVMKPGLRIVPLGGLEEIGRNMMAIEYHDEIMIVDMGLQFPESDMPGVDYIVPNIDYLRPRVKHIRGAVITHGHYDHIGAIPHLLKPLGNPPLYASALTRAIVLKRMEDFKEAPQPHITLVKANDKIKIGRHFEVEFIHINHNIPDSFALAIHTPEGTIVNTGDFKFDSNPINEAPADTTALERLGKQGVLALLSDSTDVEEPGHSIPETEIKSNMEEIFTQHPNNRLMFATFSSLLSRVQQVFDLAFKYGRKVAVDGFSMKSNVEIARALGYIKTARDVQIQIKDVDKYKPNQLVILCTGAQGEGNAVLMRIAQREHKYVRVQPGDVVVFSSSVIPGNERAVQGVKDIIYRQGARVIHYKMMDIHAGGHAAQDDLRKMIELVKPKFFFPVHGNYYMLKLHTELAQKAGVPPENTFIMNNGDCAHISKDNVVIERGVAPTNYIFVDGLGVGDVGEIVLRDRQKMSEDGMFVVIATVDSKTGKLRDKIDIISRGFVYMNESKELMAEVRRHVRNMVARSAGKEYTTNWAYVKNNIRDNIGELLFERTHRHPLVLPVVLEV